MMAQLDYSLAPGDSINRKDKKGLKQGKWIYTAKKRGKRKDKNLNLLILQFEDKFGGWEEVLKRIREQEKGLRYYKEYKGDQIVDVGYFRNDEPHGLWVVYDPNGDTSYTAKFNEGKLDGRVTHYHKNATIEMVQDYEDDEKHGKAIYFDTLGNVIRSQYYTRGGILGEYTLSGYVVDKTEPLSNCKVQLLDKRDRVLREVLTHESGSYSIEFDLQEFPRFVRYYKEGYAPSVFFLGDPENSHYSNKDLVFNYGIGTRDTNAVRNISSGTFVVHMFDKTSKVNTLKNNILSNLFLMDSIVMYPGSIFQDPYIDDIQYTEADNNFALKFLIGRPNAVYKNKNYHRDINKYANRFKNKMLREAEKQLEEKISLLEVRGQLDSMKLIENQMAFERQSILNEKKSSELAMLQKERELQQMKITSQLSKIAQASLLAQLDKQKLDSINRESKLQQLELERSEQALKLRERVALFEKNQAELEAEKTQSQHREELHQKEWLVSISIFGIFILLITGGFFLWSAIKQRKAKLQIAQEKEIAERMRIESEQAKEIIEVKNKEIVDSINYAKRIQSAILPPIDGMKDYFKDCFVLYKPKDIVAGDFYWYESIGDEIIAATADCTGHGVPGAMVSVVCHNALNRAVKEFDLRMPSDILDKTRELVIEAFEKNAEDVKDGMDIALISFNTKTRVLRYSGANNSMYIVTKDVEAYKSSIDSTLEMVGDSKIKPVSIFQSGEQKTLGAPMESGVPALIEFKADKQPVGKYRGPEPFKCHEIVMKEGDMVYVFTDGFADQFGGVKGKKYKYKTFKKFLIDNHEKELVSQQSELDVEFESWRGELEQIDDVCVVGVKV